MEDPDPDLLPGTLACRILELQFLCQEQNVNKSLIVELTSLYLVIIILLRKLFNTTKLTKAKSIKFIKNVMSFFSKKLQLSMFFRVNLDNQPINVKMYRNCVTLREISRKIRQIDCLATFKKSKFIKNRLFLR